MYPTFDKGLIHLCQEYMAKKQWSEKQQAETNGYLSFLARRSKGEIPTGARFVRDFVLKHKAYK